MNKIKLDNLKEKMPQSNQIKNKVNNSDFMKEAEAFIQKVKNKEFDFELDKRALIFIALILIVAFGGDQLTKFIASRKLMSGQNYEIIDNFFYFTYVHNEGMAWSLLEGRRWLFILFTLVAIVGEFYFFINTRKHEIFTRYGLVLLFAGTIGNFVDRLFLGYVRDFIHFYIFDYDFPIFNIADIAVVVGMGIIILEIIIQEYQIWKLSKSL